MTHKVHSPFEYISIFFKEREREKKEFLRILLLLLGGLLYHKELLSLFRLSLSLSLGIYCVLPYIPSEGQNTPRVGVVWCPKKEERGSSGVQLLEQKRTFTDRVLKKKNRDPK